MKHLLQISFFLLLSIPLSAQIGDGLDDRIISTYENPVEVARNTITFRDGFTTVGHDDLHAYIDTLLPPGGYVEGVFNMNYIRVFVPIKDNKTSQPPTHPKTGDFDQFYANWNETIQYFDGLGRPIQTVQVKASPRGADVVQPVVYDDYGRQTQNYLPYTVNNYTNNEGYGGYRPQPIDEQQNFYSLYTPENSSVAFSETRFDNSPLNRVMEQGAPGVDWQIGNEHTIRYDYQTNTEELNWNFEILDDGTLRKDEPYPTNSLYKTKTIDENDKISYQYTNKLGQVVAVQQQIEGEQYATTLYIYDIYGLKRYIIPPEAADEIMNASVGDTWNVNSPVIKKYCYYYEYDGRRRNIIKQLPGAEPVYIVYDKRDLPVFTQDGNLRENNEWSFVKYDAFKRPIITGIYKADYPISINAMQSWVSSQETFWETYDNSTNEYSNDALPEIDSDCTVFSVNYYDSYDYLDNLGAEFDFIAYSGYEQTYNNKVKGQVTVTKTLIDDPDNIISADVQYLFSVTYYDQYYRVIQTISDNHLGGQDIFSNHYNFVGELLETKQEHSSSELDNPITLNSITVYDRMSRPLSTTLEIQIDGTDMPRHVSSTFEYNELGQLINKDLGTDNACIVSTDYQYNIRGWNTNINSNYFTQTMHYNDGPNPLYNGNISQIEWNGFQDSENKTYDYTYDGLDRILTANYSDPSFRDFSTSYSYDKSGNILTLSRQGEISDDTYGEIDNLTYTYGGNQLQWVDDINDENHNNNGFTDKGSFKPVHNPVIPVYEYEYDYNGNLIKDQNKQITEISYNHQNLPTNVKFYDNERGEHNISYLYDPNGTKLRMKSENITDYIGNFVYINDTLAFILMPEGRILLDNSTNSITFNYYIKDHLGNTRTIIDETGELLESDSYYPFGMQINALSYSSATPENKYLYNGKELIKDFGLDLYDYGARNYDPQIARWSAVDPLAEKYYSLTPYNYVANSPMIFVDPNGMSAIIPPDSYVGVSETGQKRFDKILQNISSFTENESFMNAFRNTTGLNDNEIQEFLTYGSGPKVNLIDGTNAEATGSKDFNFGKEIINYLGSIDESDNNALSKQAFGVAMVLIDELAHCGDMKFNETNTSTGQTFAESDRGKQNWFTSPTLHRGGDPQLFGFGVNISVAANYAEDSRGVEQYPGQIIISKPNPSSDIYYKAIPGGVPTVPNMGINDIRKIGSNLLK